MSAVNLLANRWINSGYLTRTAAVIYLAPVAIWGVSTLESIFRCALRALHTTVALSDASRSYRWEQTQIHAANAYGTGLLTLVSPVPIIGTVKSYWAIFRMISNHVSNTWELRDLQQRANAHAADTLYQELHAWEPNIDKLLSDAVDRVPPTSKEIDQTARRLQASLIGRSWVYTGLFHLLDGSCRALSVVATRVGRLISALFDGHLLHALIRGVVVILDGVKQETQYVCNLVDQPGRANVSEKPVPNLYRDNIQSILEKCKTPKSREEARLLFAKLPTYRQYATSNALARLSTDSSLPAGAPNNYFHLLRELPAACAHYSKLTKLQLEPILRCFRTIFPCLEKLDSTCTAKMTSESKKNLLWSLTKQLPNLREVTLDMNGIDPRWQMLIAVQLAKYSPELRKVTLINTDARTATIMRRFSSWFCTVTVQ